MANTSTIVSILAAVAMVPTWSIAAPDRTEDPHHPDWPEAELSAAKRRERAAFIRDAAASAGMTNAALLAGIGQVETGFAHCWSEATWACKGPASSSCDGGPVISGSADGPCSIQQGGLGMFQFDAGTHSQTLAMYGDDILTIEGNTAEVIPFLVKRAIESVSGVNSEQEALDWMNSIPIQAGHPEFERWGWFTSYRYNGCKGCSSQEQKYKDGAIMLWNEMGGEEFWSVSDGGGGLGPADSISGSCEPIPEMGKVIDDADPCFTPEGPSSYWRSVAGGEGGDMLWTKATDSDTPSNYGVWTLQFEKSAVYELRVRTDGGKYGQSQRAAYEVTHGRGVRMVTIDQTAEDGWQSLGKFPFRTNVVYQVRLNDNTGEPSSTDTKLMFDALDVRSLDATYDNPGEGGGISVGCSTSGSSQSTLGLLLAAILMFRRRRRR